MKKYLLIIFLMLAPIFVVVVYQLKFPQLIAGPVQIQSASPSQQAFNNLQIGQTLEFTGHLTNFIDACKVDGRCVAYVDTIPVVINAGERAAPAVGKSDVSAADLGKMVKVKAIKEAEESLTLVGRTDLYVLKVNQ